MTLICFRSAFIFMSVLIYHLIITVLNCLNFSSMFRAKGFNGGNTSGYGIQDVAPQAAARGYVQKGFFYRCVLSKLTFLLRHQCYYKRWHGVGWRSLVIIFGSITVELLFLFLFLILLPFQRFVSCLPRKPPTNVLLVSSPACSCILPCCRFQDSLRMPPPITCCLLQTHLSLEVRLTATDRSAICLPSPLKPVADRKSKPHW